MTKTNSRSSYSKVVIALTLVASLAMSTFVPENVQAAESGIFASAVKGLSNILSFGKDDEVAAQTEVKAFPVSEDREPFRVVSAVMTAYSSEAAQTDATPCIPAMWKYNLCEHYEKYGEQDTIAANFLPLGTKVRFPDLYGDKVFTVRDRMNARYGQGRGDIWMPTKVEAKQFGVKRVTMEIYSK